MALLPASASAIIITISALNDEATTLDVTMTGTAAVTSSLDSLKWDDIGDFVTDYEGPSSDFFDITGGITATDVEPQNVTGLYLDWDGGGGDDFRIVGSFEAGTTYSFSGSGTINLLEEGSFNFGDLIKGTYNLEDGNISGTGHSLVIQYSSVPDTGSTAALLGVGVFVLAAARRRLG
ncbi:MAG: VPDSG-CTERM sorting domain-containing protein [Opitutales bacterium]